MKTPEPSYNASEPVSEKRSFFSKIIRFVVVMAAVGILLALGVFAYLSFKQKEYVTTGNKRTIVLRDGSEIVLNANSSLKHNAGFGLINRKVSLSGEAFFRVRKGRWISFIVTTSTARIKVTGTLFNVKAINTATEVGVTQGKVELTSAQKKGGAIMLSEGFYSLCMANNTPGQPTQLQYAGYPEWMNNKFEYNQEPLKAVLAGLEAHFSIKIKVNDPEILNIKVTGNIEGASPEVVLQTLAALIDKYIRFNNDTYEIY